MIHIVLPQVRLGLLTAWVITFVLAFGELGVSILVAPPGESTLPIRIYTIIANTPSSQVAALALLQTTVTLAPVVVPWRSPPYMSRSTPKTRPFSRIG
jgi:ABC-type spermidine/putrescine transport system permease subunit II